MSLYLSAQAISKSYGSKALFEDLSFSIFANDKIGLIGPNGAGKSTLLKILAEIFPPDTGALSKKKGIRMGYVPQSSEFPEKLPLDILIASIDDKHLEDYEKEYQAKTALSKIGFTSQANIMANKLSGGWKKRLAVAQALVNAPDILILDEPTNHLDLEGVLWLESFLQKEVSTYVLVSHDRYFLENMTNKIVEINSIYKEGALTISGSYKHFSEKKHRLLEGQKQQEKSLATKVRRETDWLRETPKARTTKARYRIDKAFETIEEHQDVASRNRRKKAQIDFQGSDRQTHKLLQIKNLKLTLGEKLLFENLDLVIASGTRLGLMGPNGSGKTSLLKLINKEMSPEQGTIKEANDLKIVYFDQHRNKLPLDKTLKEVLSPNGDFVNFRGRQIHVNGWCQRFLFPKEMMNMPINKLSGGERARIAIAHLMLMPADILLLDEPTNDLDIETLQTLEESLLDFSGAVILITHDRCMLDRICNKFLALGDPKNTELFATYSQWEKTFFAEKKQKKKEITSEKKSPASSSKGNQAKSPSVSTPPLSYETKQQLKKLERKIKKKEELLHQLNEDLLLPENANDLTKLQSIYSDIEDTEKEVEKLYDELASLES